MSHSNEQPESPEGLSRPKVACPKCGKEDLQVLNKKYENEAQFQVGTLAAAQQTKAILFEIQCLGCNHRFTLRQTPPSQ